MLAARSSPQIESGHPAEHEQRLAHGTGGSMNEYALSSLYMGGAMKKLVCGRPAQNQRRCFRRVNVSGHATNISGAERAIVSIRAEYGHIRHSIAKLKSAYAVTKLIDFADDTIAQRERRPAAHRLWVEVASDNHVRVLQARGEHAHPHLAARGHRQRNLDDLQPIGTAEALDLNNPVVRFAHTRIPALLAGTWRGNERDVIEQDQYAHDNYGAAGRGWVNATTKQRVTCIRRTGGNGA